MSTTAHNKDIIQKCFANASRGNRAVLEEILGPDFVIHAPEEYRGVDGLLEMAGTFPSAFPDLAITVDHQLCRRADVPAGG